MRMCRYLTILLVSSLLGSGIGNVNAQAPEEPPAAASSESARELFARGQSAYQQGDYAEAALLWVRAYELDARPQLQYNLAQVYGRLGQIENEHAALERFIAETSPEDPLLTTSRYRLAMLERRLAQTGIVLVAAPTEGDASYEGALVRIDGEERGLLPRRDAFLLRPGSHTIDVSLSGHEPFRATVVVPAGESVEVAVALTPLPAVVTPASGPRMGLPIALYSAGGGLVLAGAITGGLALSSSSDHPVEGTEAADRAMAWSISSDVLLGVGVAAGAAGLVVHLVRRRSAEGEDDTSVSLLPSVGPDHVGLRASGRF